MRTRSVALVIAGLVAATATLGCKSNTIDASNTTNTFGSAIVGAAGGVVTSEDQKASVRIPQGALQADTRISIKAVETSQAPPMSADFAPTTPLYAFEPHGLKFLSPAIVAIDHPGGSGISMLRAEPGGSWTQLSTATINGTGAEVTTTTFSFFAVVGPPSNNNNSSSGGAERDSGTGSIIEDPCAALALPITGDNGTYSGLSGSLVGAAGPFDLAVDTKSAYVIEQSTSGLIIVFTDRVLGAAQVSNGTVAIGTKSLGIALSRIGGAPLVAGTYTYAGGGDGTIMGADTSTINSPPGLCPLPNPIGSPASNGAAITISTYNTATFSGSINVSIGGSTLTATLTNLPVVKPKIIFDSKVCCISAP